MTKISQMISWLFHMILAKIMPKRFPKACQSILTPWAFWAYLCVVFVWSTKLSLKTQWKQTQWKQSICFSVVKLCMSTIKPILNILCVLSHFNWSTTAERKLSSHVGIFCLWTRKLPGRRSNSSTDTQLTEPEPGDHCSSLLPLDTLALALIYPFCCSEKTNLKTQEAGPK